MSAGKWRVWNKHPEGYTHTERFRDETVKIKAGEYVLMDYEDATLFKGQYFPMKKDDFGVQTPQSMKCIFIEPHDGSVLPLTKKFISPLDGQEFATADELEAHVEMLAKENEALLVKDETLDKELEAAASKKTKRAST